MKRIKSKKYIGVFLRKTKDGDTVVYFSFKNSKGNTSYKKVGLKSQGVTERYASEKRNEVILLLNNGETPYILSNDKSHRLFFEDIANFYFDNHITKSSERRRQYTNRIHAIIGKRNVYKLSTSDIHSFQELLKKEGLSSTTVIQYTELISTIYNYYSKVKSIKLNNPAYNISKPSINNRRERVLTKDEIEEVYDVIQSDFTMTLFFALALSTAGRKSTILNYKIKDVNLQDKTIISYDFKNDSTYKSFLDDRTFELVQLRIDESKGDPNAPLVYRPDTKDLGRWISREFKLVFDNLFNQGLAPEDRQNRVVIHSLRHTVLSHLGRQGANVFLLQKISNHKSIDMVSRYTKMGEDTGKYEIDNLWSNHS